MKKILILFLTTVCITLLVIFLSLLVINRKYQTWVTDFEMSMNTQYLVNSESSIEDEMQKKISEYSLSEDFVDSLELTPQEVGYILFNILSQYSNDTLTFSNVYIEPEKSLWTLCTQVSFTNNNLSPWVCTDVSKDNVQSAEIYLTDVRVGPFSLTNVGNILEKVNMGIAKSLLTVNENGFSERYFENIQLLDDKLVIKGSQY